MNAERPLTGAMPVADLAAYRARGGFARLAETLNHGTPQDVVRVVSESGLRGRGGAGFPTGQKWSFVPPIGADAGPRYFVVNADEMEPGTFKDRWLIEGNPYQLIEGVLYGAYAIGAATAYIFLRANYGRAQQRLEQALAEVESAGFLGEHIAGSPYTLQIYLHVSAGRYMCGEETGLLNALEGKRANPRFKPPFPQVSGLFGRPTIINNVETVCNLPHIMAHGAAWFKALSRSSDGGTKIYGVSGRVEQPGAWELPLGVPLRELLEEHAGGMQAGYALRGLIPGGASTDFLLPEHLDVAMDFESVQKAGSRLGTGTMIILDDRTCPVGFVAALERFFARESCGWCTPCREGLPWVAAILDALEAGQGTEQDLDALDGLCRLLAPGNTFCALAPGAMEPLQSALRFFRADFERHAHEGKCPWEQA
jgi:NADH-quinone oxidoreductase subunit F